MASIKKRGFLAIVIILILALLAAVVWLIVAAATNVNAICLFKHNYDETGKCIRCGVNKPLDDISQSTVVDNNGNIMSSDKVYDIPEGLVFASARQLYASAPTSNPNVTLQLTVAPDNDYTQALHYIWSLAFANPDSEWASGKNVEDYVTASTNNFSDWRHCKITCVEGFGEQIILTVKSPVNDVQKTCTIDFEKPVVNCGFEIVEVDNESNKPLIVQADGTCIGSLPLNTLTTEDKMYNVVFTPEYGVGTIVTEQKELWIMCENDQDKDQMAVELDISKPIAFNKAFVELFDGYGGYLNRLQYVGKNLSFTIIAHKYGNVDFGDGTTGKVFTNIPVDISNSELAPKSFTISEEAVVLK